MNNIDANTTETLAYLFTICMFFIPPLIVLVCLKMIDPRMECIRCKAFYIGWMPMNLISCGYFAYTTGSFANFIAILVCCQIMQLFLVMFMRYIFIEIFGDVAFENRN
jgi:hypothetical protein